MTVKYFKCMHCGNIIEKITDKGVPVMCCGEPMKELIAGETDAAVENMCLYIQLQVIMFM